LGGDWERQLAKEGEKNKEIQTSWMDGWIEKYGPLTFIGHFAGGDEVTGVMERALRMNSKGGLMDWIEWGIGLVFIGISFEYSHL
jgi:hypothetical protein